MFGTGIVDPSLLAVSALAMVALVAVGIMLFTHIERDFMDTV